MTGSGNNPISVNVNGGNNQQHSSSPLLDHRSNVPLAAQHLSLPSAMRAAPYPPAAPTTTSNPPTLQQHHLLPSNNNINNGTSSNHNNNSNNVSFTTTAAAGNASIPSANNANAMQQLTNALTQFQNFNPAPQQNNQIMQSIAAAQILLNHPGVAQAAALTAAIQQLLQQTQMVSQGGANQSTNVTAAPNANTNGTMTHSRPHVTTNETFSTVNNSNPVAVPIPAQTNNVPVLVPVPAVGQPSHAPTNSSTELAPMYHPSPPSAPPAANTYVLPPHTKSKPISSVPHSTASPIPPLPTKAPTLHKPSPRKHTNSGGTPSPSGYAPLPPGKPQLWTVQQLQAHILYLQSTNQPISQPLKLMLVEAQRREDKKTAKRAANRRSASESRARKKAFVEQMTEDNLRLKRQAQILALLPDLVLAMREDGVITFVSAQVERILQYTPDTLVEGNIFDLVAPTSHNSLKSLLRNVVKRATATPPVVAPTVQQNAIVLLDNSTSSTGESKIASTSTVAACAGMDGKVHRKHRTDENPNSNANNNSSDDAQFPMGVVVKVHSTKVSGSNKHASNPNTDSVNPNTDNNTSNVMPQASSTTSSTNSHSNTAVLSSKATSSLSDSNERNSGGSEEGSGSGVEPQSSSASDGDSNTSNSSSEQARKESEALARNVHSHNASRMPSVWRHTDDVIGDGVTENNAEARLSSLQHPSSSKKGMPSESNNATLQQETNSNSSDSLLTGVEDKHPRKKPTSADGHEMEEDDMSTSSSRSQSTRSSIALLEEEEEEDVDDLRCSASGTPSPSCTESEDRLPSSSRKRRRSRPRDRSPNRSRRRTRSSSKRPPPLAPTCNVCMLRADGSSVWCEVTCSVKTQLIEEESEIAPGGQPLNAAEQEVEPAIIVSSGSQSQGSANSSSAPIGDDGAGSNHQQQSLQSAQALNGTNAVAQPQTLNEGTGTTTNTSLSSSSSGSLLQIEELLLCLRPLREGGTVAAVGATDGTVSQPSGQIQSQVQSSPSSKPSQSPRAGTSSMSSSHSNTSDDAQNVSNTSTSNARNSSSSNSNKSNTLCPNSTAVHNAEDTQRSRSIKKLPARQDEEDNNYIVKSAVESLMLMNKVMHNNGASGVSKNTSCNKTKEV